MSLLIDCISSGGRLSNLKSLSSRVTDLPAGGVPDRSEGTSGNPVQGFRAASSSRYPYIHLWGKGGCAGNLPPRTDTSFPLRVRCGRGGECVCVRWLQEDRNLTVLFVVLLLLPALGPTSPSQLQRVVRAAGGHWWIVEHRSVPQVGVRVPVVYPLGQRAKVWATHAPIRPWRPAQSLHQPRRGLQVWESCSWKVTQHVWNSRVQKQLLGSMGGGHAEGHGVTLSSSTAPTAALRPNTRLVTHTFTSITEKKETRWSGFRPPALMPSTRQQSY